MLKAPTTSAVCTYDHDAQARPSLVNPQLAACSELRELLTLEYLHIIVTLSVDIEELSILSIISILSIMSDHIVQQEGVVGDWLD